VPQRYLEQVMQQLVRAGILKGCAARAAAIAWPANAAAFRWRCVRVAESIEDVEEKNPSPFDLGIRIVAPLIQTLQDGCDGAA